jgi:hypothetical protein
MTFAGTARVVLLAADRVVVDVDLSQPGYLVTTDSYDDGWRASVDGRPAALLRANVAFRAVELPPGRHRVEQCVPPEERAGRVVDLRARARRRLRVGAPAATEYDLDTVIALATLFWRPDSPTTAAAHCARASGCGA